MRRFTFHYNRPASLAAKRVRWSVHFAGKCHIVDKIICQVPVESHINKRQPVAVMRGWCNSVACNSLPGGAAVIA